MIVNGGLAVWSCAATAGSGNAIIGNSIVANTGPGIDLGADGATANDPVTAIPGRTTSSTGRRSAARSRPGLGR